MDYVYINTAVSCKKSDILLVLQADLTAAKSILSDAKNRGDRVIDICSPNPKKPGATHTGGRKKRGALIVLSNHSIIITNLSYKTLIKRINDDTQEEDS